MVNFSIVFLYLLLLLIVRNAYDHPTIHGRYTRDIEDYHLVIPHKLTDSGNFLTFSLPHYFKHEFERKRKKRSIDDGVNYGILLHGTYHHLELWPNYELLSPAAVVEKRDPTISVQKQDITSLNGKKVCHYRGKIRGEPNSRVAISTCDGLAGYVIVGNEKYYVEPLMDHGANKRGHHLHMIYKRSVNFPKPNKFCGTTSNWEDEWRASLKKRYLENNDFKDTNKRTIESKHRYLEIAIICDRKIIKFHKKIDLRTYVMTIMNMVYDNYHDASSGNQMDIAVVRIIYLEKEEKEIDLMIAPGAQDTLRSFCDWQVTINPKDVKNPIHHDIAVLFTRHNLCDQKDNSCELMGLAYVATPCSKKEPCAINEDSGLMLSVVATHEIGHIMGCAHDSPKESGCEQSMKDGSFNVMAPAVHLNTRQFSTCSRTFISDLLNDLGDCLLDAPEESDYKFAHILPGVIYDHGYQCDWYQKGSFLCGKPEPSMCTDLMCTEDRRKCFGNSEPAADGTTCGKNKWCYRMKCVDSGRRPDAIHGGWGEWGKWTECSRTCGIGVSFQERECNNPLPEHGGRYCLGVRKKIELCNTNPCPDGSPNFRAVQCTEKNKVPHNNMLYEWKPFFKEDKPCELTCINQEHVYVKLAPRVKDGTKCKRGTKNICIAGTCRKVGCDMKIDSDAMADICGVCEGDGTTCKIIEDTYRGQGNDYTKIAEVPKGALNLEFDELAPSANTIAISEESGQFCLNGDHTERGDDVYYCAGEEGVYSHPEPQMEKYVLPGPLKKKLNLFVVFYNPYEMVGYHYKYADPSQPNPDFKPNYHWEVVDWGECSALCGGGTKIGEPSCIEEKLGKVSPSRCKNIEKPPPETCVCNELPCAVKWRTGKWGKCMACKNQSGVRVREVECVRETSIPNGDDVVLEDDLCPPPKPPTRELCDSGRKCVARKRESGLDIPSDMMRDVWYQTIIDMINVDPSVRKDVVVNARTLRKINRDLRRHLRYRSLSDICGDLSSLSQKAKNQNDKAKDKKPNDTSNKSESKDTTKNKNEGKSSSKNETKGGNEEKKPKLKVKVGSIVEDRVQPGDIKVVEVTLKSAPPSNISDEAFEKMGDEMLDTIDFKHEKVITGKEAAEKLKEFQNDNKTATDV